MNVGGALNASLEAIQADVAEVQATVLHLQDEVAQLNIGQAQLQAGQEQLQAGQEQLQAQLQAGQAVLQDGLQQLQIAVANIGVSILSNLISPSLFNTMFFGKQFPLLILFFFKNQLAGVFPNVDDKNLLRKLSNKAAALSEPLMPLLRLANLQPYPQFPLTKANLALMTGPQLAAALTFYDQPNGGSKGQKYIRFAKFIGVP